MLRSETPVFGRIPQGATHWSIRKRGPLSWEWCTYAGREGIVQQEFAIGDLSITLIRKRWGAGTYRVMFVSLTRGARQVFGNGKVFELTSANQTGSPRPTGRQPSPPGLAASTEVARSPSGTSDHGDMVRALLAAGEGSKTARELFDALAIPTGMGLSSLFSFQERATERLEGIERRLAAIEERLTGAARPQPIGRVALRPVVPPADSTPAPDAAWDRVLDKLEAIEARLARTDAPRKSSPGAGSRRVSPNPR